MAPFQPITLLVPEIKELLAEKDHALLKQVLKDCNPVGLVDSWEKFTEEEKLQIFQLLSGAAALRLFKALGVDDQHYLLSKLGEENVAPLLTSMTSPNLAEMFQKMPPRIVNRMRAFMKRGETLSRVDLLMQFPKHSAGSLMHPEFIKLPPKLTARQALSRLQAVVRPRQKEHLSALYVTDEDGKLLGAVDLYDLLAASEDEKLSEIMTSVEGFKVKPETDQEEVASLVSKFSLSSAPVVDDDSRLIGIIPAKDMVSVVQQESTEDIAKMAGTHAMDLKESSVFKTVGYRTPWLVVTLFGGLLVSFIIKNFEPVLAKVIALASFSPLISAMGGNIGSQSATIVVRSLALGQIKDAKDRARTIFHETKVGVLMGLIYATCLGLMAHLLYSSQYHWQFSFAVSIAMLTSITIASTLASIGPLLLDKFHIDPANATSPLITTITDIVTNLIYYSLATFLWFHWKV